MKILFLAAAVSSFQDAPLPAPDPFCDDIRTLARGAEEEDPFRSLRKQNFRPRLGRGYCFFSDARGYTCGHNLAQASETPAAYAAQIQNCLPGSVRSTDRDYLRQEEVVRRGRFEARVVERGRDRGHVGRTINIYIHSVAESAEAPSRQH